MYIINISVNSDITSTVHEQLFPRHVSWFKKYFELGKFVVVGPYSDREHAGVIIAQTGTRAELESILQEDPYYRNLAHYEIREFIPKLIAANLSDFQIK